MSDRYKSRGRKERTPDLSGRGSRARAPRDVRRRPRGDHARARARRRRRRAAGMPRPRWRWWGGEGARGGLCSTLTARNVRDRLTRIGSRESRFKASSLSRRATHYRPSVPAGHGGARARRHVLHHRRDRSRDRGGVQEGAHSMLPGAVPEAGRGVTAMCGSPARRKRMKRRRRRRRRRARSAPASTPRAPT